MQYMFNRNHLIISMGRMARDNECLPVHDDLRIVSLLETMHTVTAMLETVANHPRGYTDGFWMVVTAATKLIGPIGSGPGVVDNSTVPRHPADGTV